MQIDKLKLTTIKYVTERKDLVIDAILNILPENMKKSISPKSFKRTSLIGQYGDPMLFLELSISKNPEQAVKHIFSKLTETEKKRLIEEFDTRMDDETTTFYFRLDKFAPLQDELYLNDGSDVIKAEIKFRIYGKYNAEAVKQYLKDLMEIE